jgi:ABC-type transport system involved in cytochrome c biogenesis permease subunit
MLLPIAVIIAFSFNDPVGRYNFTWVGFTLEHWKDAFSIPELNDALLKSIELAALATLIATILGTLLALALVRYEFFGRRAANFLIVIPMATPEVVIGAALLSMFLVYGISLGFVTLLIAHHLSLSGDTLEMMRAVLDTNLWLATHVVIVTIGYAATFLAGFLALIYVFRGTLTKSLDQATADAIARMVYGIVCFATLCSLTGTVLGGIWADQSWGRFWGWDPKENGAALVVLVNAIILHARWGGLIRERGIMVAAVGGNIVTAWSWFGTNMLGVGLHSYGFMEPAVFWMMAFVVSQLLLMALGLLPARAWRSGNVT